MSTNLFASPDKDLDSLPRVVLPEPLSKLVIKLTEDNFFPERWTETHEMHSEVRALAKWLETFRGDVGISELADTRAGERWACTMYNDGADHKLVEPCVNCKVLLQWLGFEILMGNE